MNRTWQSLMAVLLLFAPLAVRAADWSEPAAQFAREIAAAAGPGATTITVRNASSLTSEQVTEIRRALEAQLRAQGLRPVNPGSAPAEVAVTFSENVRGYLWAAEVRQGAETKVVLREVARAASAGASGTALSVSLRRTLLWAQAEPILDVATIGDEVVVLGAEKVWLHKLDAGGSAPARSLEIAHSRPWPRDLRGRLVTASDHPFDAYLPGVICTGTLTPAPSLNCREGDDPWPIGAGQAAFFGAARNFFTGALSPGISNKESVAPFYSAAAVDRAPSTIWFFTGIDGTVRQTDGANERVLTSARDWGNGIASLKTDCGTLLLASANGDGTAPDSVRAYAVTDGEPVAASAPLEMAGPVTALWPASSGIAGTAVVHNLKTDRYEAFTISAACGQ